MQNATCSLAIDGFQLLYIPSLFEESDGACSVDDDRLNDSNEFGMNPSSSEDHVDDHA
jgi:hypothetical protein